MRKSHEGGVGGKDVREKWERCGREEGRGGRRERGRQDEEKPVSGR